jgi:hypothetical protein
MTGAERDPHKSPFLPLDETNTTSALTDVLERIRRSEINFHLSHFFDRGYLVALGDHMNGWKGHCLVDNLDEAAAWFEKYAAEVWPHSTFAKEVQRR